MLVAAWSSTLFAQIPPPGGSRPGEVTTRRTGDADSTVLFVRPVDFYRQDTLQTGTLDPHTHNYHPAQRQVPAWGHLGNLGSAHRRHYFDLIETKGLDIGQHQYDLYRRNFTDFRFYQAEIALTEFNYSQGLDQLDGILEARFGRSFARGVNTSLDYLRINQEGAFQQQRAKHTAFGFGIWYDAPDGRYDGLYHYGSNSIVQEDNGGIVSYDDLRIQQLVANVPVRLNDALTVHRERAFSMQHHLHLIRAVDSLPGRTLVDLIHTGGYRTGFVRFSDATLTSDIGYYGAFALDDRGIRHFIDWQTVDNQLDLQFRFRAHADRPRYHLLKAGLQYRYTHLGQEPASRRVNETFLNATGRLWLTRKIRLSGAGYLALTGQSGDFSLQGDLAYETDNGGTLAASLLLYSRSPWVTEERFYVTQQPVWELGLADYTHVRLQVTGELPELDLQWGGAIHLVDNIVYYDTSRAPVQIANTRQVYQAFVRKGVSVGKIGLSAMLALQEAPDQLALPGWIAQGQLFYTDRWFKQRLLVRTGIEVRMTGDYRGINYFPLTGQFHLDDTRPVEQYPAADLFFAMQVKSGFRAFFKIENASAYFLDQPFVQVVDYPHFEAYFRLGLWMKLFD